MNDSNSPTTSPISPNATAEAALFKTDPAVTVAGAPPLEVKPPEVTPPVVKTPEQLAVETKTAEDAAKSALVTEADLKFPDGVTKDEPTVKAFIETLNDAKLSPQERANKLIDLQSDAAKALTDSYQAQWDKIRAEWIKEAKAHPEIGGANLDPALAGISKMIDTYGGPEVRELFNYTGSGDNPHMIVFMNKLAKIVNERGPEPFRGTPPGVLRTPESVLFGDKTK